MMALRDEAIRHMGACQADGDIKERTRLKNNPIGQKDGRL